MTALPIIKYKSKKYIFDYRLMELRTTSILFKKLGATKGAIRFIRLRTSERDVLEYAIKHKDRKLINQTMRDLISYA